jgi:hypothetical protein
LRLGRFEFGSESELFAYLAETFLIDSEYLGGTIRRSGKYQRIDEKGNPIFTFGDPILDLITDELGITYLSGRTIDFKLSHSTSRRGGIKSINLESDIDVIRKYQLARSVSDDGEFMLLERDSNISLIAASSPEIWFYEDGTNNSMRFHTFKHDYWKCHSIGSEIETWGGSDAHFSSASITS